MTYLLHYDPVTLQCTFKIFVFLIYSPWTVSRCWNYLKGSFKVNGSTYNFLLAIHINYDPMLFCFRNMIIVKNQFFFSQRTCS